jgi:hypothetical protein
LTIQNEVTNKKSNVDERHAHPIIIDINLGTEKYTVKLAPGQDMKAAAKSFS